MLGPTAALQPSRPKSTAASELRPQAFRDTGGLEDSSPILVNAPMAEDVEVLERYLAAQDEGGAAVTRPYVRFSTTDGQTIVYRSVAKRRKGLRQASSPGAAQLEIVENVLGSMSTDVIKLYGTFAEQRTTT